jgi:hypothetical protein
MALRKNIRKTYMALGPELLDALCQNFDGACFSEDLEPTEYKRLNLPSGLSVSFRKWGDKDKPFYIILFLGNKYIFELDLSRIIEKDGHFTWYLNRPTNTVNRSFLDKVLDWVEEIPSDYLDSVRKIKKIISAGHVVPKSGYCLCDQFEINKMKSSFVEIIQIAIGNHLNIPSQKEDTPVEYDLNDQRAVEGYEQDRIITTFSRNKSLVEQCKRRDKYTCQACGFRLEIHGQFIIECHHINPVSQDGMRLSSIDELICLCPTCHRIAHKRSKPFSIDEIRGFRQSKT